MQGTLGYKQKPQCVHISTVHADLLPTDVYSGMYARVTVNFFPYDASGNRGVGCGLGNVCKTRDGEPLGSLRIGSYPIIKPARSNGRSLM